jgi:hypothetical protein
MPIATLIQYYLYHRCKSSIDKPCPPRQRQRYRRDHLREQQQRQYPIRIFLLLIQLPVLLIPFEVIAVVTTAIVVRPMKSLILLYQSLRQPHLQPTMLLNTSTRTRQKSTTSKGVSIQFSRDAKYTNTVDSKPRISYQTVDQIFWSIPNGTTIDQSINHDTHMILIRITIIMVVVIEVFYWHIHK